MDELIEDMAMSVAEFDGQRWQGMGRVARERSRPRAAIAAIHARGDRVVPGVATAEMLAAGREAQMMDPLRRSAVFFTAMLSASPYAPEETK